MSDVIERIKQRTAKEYERLSIAITETDKFTKQGLLDCIKEFENTFIDIVDEELAKEPQECEWNRQGAEDFIITGCGHRPYKVIIDNCGFKIDFCPYCGKQVEWMKNKDIPIMFGVGDIPKQ